MNRPVRGYDAMQIANLGPVVSQGFAVPIGDHAARLAQDGFGGAGVPLAGARAGVDIDVREAFGDQAEFQPHTAVLNVIVYAQLFADAVDFSARVGTAHRHDYLRRVADGRDAASFRRPLLFDERPHAGRGVIHPVRRRVINDADLSFAFDRQADHHGEFAYAFDELFGAVHRVNHPDAVFLQTRQVVRDLFGQDGVAGEAAAQFARQQFIRGVVRRRHRIVAPFPFHLRLPRVKLEKNAPRLPRQLPGDF